MEKEVISQKQAILIMSTFMIGASTIVGSGTEAQQDIWISIFIAVAMAFIVLSVYGRIAKLFPGKDIYEMLQFLFGKVFGKIVGIFYIWYAFYLGVLIRRNFSEFARIVSLPETPHEIFAFFSAIFVIWAVRSGIEVFGRYLSILFPIFAFVILFITAVSAPLFDFDNLKPVLYNGLEPVIKGSFDIFSFPFAETILFLAVFGSIRENSSTYKIYYISLLISSFFLCLITVRSILIFGIPNFSIQNFASYASARLIKIGDFFQRIEASVAIVFIISGHAKATVCLYVAAKGVSNLFKIKDYRSLALPIGILIVLVSIFNYKNAEEIFEWATKVYRYYNIPFQIIIPLIMWITAEIKIRALSKKGNLPS